MNKKLVAKKVGVSESSIERWAKAGKFPPPREFGEVRVAWLSSEVDEWMLSRPVAPSYTVSEQDRLLNGVLNDDQ
ncbi:AlpA family phage regulatory protein [Vibrio kagoshimensis]|uniref:helix-turn-helix transcriptional regulator n=1 Tax=Vibrio kagoshimensis TaxID=2910244 RepID=UPI003D229FD5